MRPPAEDMLTFNCGCQSADSDERQHEFRMSCEQEKYDVEGFAMQWARRGCAVRFISTCCDEDD